METLESSYELARTVSKMDRFRSSEKFTWIMHMKIYPLLMSRFKGSHTMDDKTMSLISVIMKVVFGVEELIYAAKSFDLYDAMHIYARKDLSQRLKKWMPWVVRFIPVNPIIQVASMFLFKFVGKELQEHVNFDLLKHVATFASSMKSYGKMMAKEHITHKDKDNMVPPLHVFLCMILYCIKPAGIKMIMTSINEYVDVYLFDKKPPCGSALCDFARSHCKAAPCGHALSSLKSGTMMTSSSASSAYSSASSAPIYTRTRAKTKENTERSRTKTMPK